jgi:hypothetical protein
MSPTYLLIENGIGSPTACNQDRVNPDAFRRPIIKTDRAAA